MTLIRPYRSRLLLPRELPFTDPRARRFFYSYRRSGQPDADPLGAGNTELLADLGVTPIAFHDVRRNITLATGVSQLADVKGDGTYGPALTQGAAANQPAWDGTTINFDGADDYLLSASALAGVDLSTNNTWTAVFVGDVPSGTLFHPGMAIGAAGGVAPWWRPIVVRSGPVLQGSTDKLTLGGSLTLPTPGSIHLFISSFTLSGTSQTETIEIPPAAKNSNGGNIGAEASASMYIALGADTAGGNALAIRYRASLLWQGSYTSGQVATLKTWASKFHNAVVS